MNNIQPNNPSTFDRHSLLKKALEEANRLEDFDYIIKSTSPPKDITTLKQNIDYKNIKVGVIGGGSAGLAASYELRKLGFDITILEGNKDRIGGRAYTYYFDDYLYGELGAMRVPVSHECTWNYINEFKINTNPFIMSSKNNTVYVKNTRVKGNDINKEIMNYIYPKFNLSNWEKKTPYDELINYIYNFPLVNLNKDIRKFLYKIRKHYPHDINYYDYLNLRKLCEALGLSESAIDLIQSIEGLDRGLFYNSYLEFLREMYSLNFSYLYEIEGGMSNLPHALFNSLMNKDNPLGSINFKAGCKVNGIYHDTEKKNIHVKYIDTFKNEILTDTFDYIICAIPFSSLRLVDIYPEFSNRKMQAIREVNYSTSQKTILLCNERFWEKEYKNQILGGGSYTDLVISNIWYPSHKYSGDYGVLLASYNINLDTIRLANLRDKERLPIIKNQLEMVHGLPKGYLDSIVVDFKTINWNDEELFLGAFCMLNPEQNRVFSYSIKNSEFNNRVFFAGEHVSTFHAWVQGALQSGMDAANSIVRACNIKN